jgi:hypothetical protein
MWRGRAGELLRYMQSRLSRVLASPATDKGLVIHSSRTTGWRSLIFMASNSVAQHLHTTRRSSQSSLYGVT